MGLLHRLAEYISDLSIPVASFWYKYFLGANTVPCSQVRPNLPNFPFWALYCLPRDGAFERPAQVSGFIAPTSGIHFWSLYTRSFLLVLIFPWCKHGTMATGPSQFTQLSVLGPILPPSRWGILTSRTGKWFYCTD